MDANQHELYENAHKRIQQKKFLVYHFILFLVGSLFFFVADKLYDVRPFMDWWIWAITIWFFVYILHVIKVFVTDQFMNKEWERQQIDKLVKLQQQRIQELQKKVEQDFPTQS